MRRGLLAAVLVLVAGVRPAHAHRLPFRSYGPAEGLADAGVNRIRLGPGGFVWIATRGGLWRFDGERFDVLGPDDGVPRGEVFDFVFAADHSLWIATDAGLFHGDPETVDPQRRAFAEVRLMDAAHSELPHRVAAAADGSVWVGTFGGLWHVTPDAAGPLPRREPLGEDAAPRPGSRVQALAVDPTGAVWVGTHARGVYRLAASGRVDHCEPGVAGCFFVRDFLFDDRGGVWTAYFGGVARFDTTTFGEDARPGVLLRPSEGLPGIDTAALAAPAPGRMLLASTAGITEIDRDASGRWAVGATLDRRAGLPGDDVASLALDSTGNLWVGFARGGLAKRIAGGFAEADEAEEPGARIVALGHDREGGLVVLAESGSLRWAVHGVGRGRGETVHPPLPKGFTYVGWGRQQLLAQESDGTWWVAAGGGALRYGASRDGLRRLQRPPDSIFDASRGLASPDVYVLFADAAGDVWLSTGPIRPDRSGVARIRHGSGSAQPFSIAEIGSSRLAVGFAEDREGELWIAFEDGTLVRRRGERFEGIASPFRRLDAAPFVLDVRGRLWILGDGLAVLDRPGEARPVARAYALPESLHGISLTTGADDGAGTLYLGCTRGVVRLEPDSGRARLFTAADGLVPGLVRLAARDADGILWFSDESGLSRYTPGPDPPRERREPRIRGVRVAGVPTPVPLAGATAVGPLEVEPSQRSIEIDYFAVDHGPGEPPRFEHRLIGIDAAWSPPTRTRSVLYAGLAPGRYRFAVRAVDADGGAVSEPAVVTFRVLSPFWRRGWFVGLAACCAVGLVYGAHRIRVARAVAVERVRTRIATDLHDEIGSSLSQIAVLSQVAERDAVRGSGVAPQALSRIAALARGVTESMGETVWAISPREDRLSDLVHRMRRFALDLFADGEADLALELPSGDPDERIDPEIRRTLYLVFKEALHNARKHAGARRVEADLRRTREGFVLTVRDDGRGFDPSTPSEGHGVDGMRRRAKAIGGQIVMGAAPAGGTEIVFHAPRARTSLFRRIVGRRGGGA